MWNVRKTGQPVGPDGLLAERRGKSEREENPIEELGGRRTTTLHCWLTCGKIGIIKGVGLPPGRVREGALF